MAVKTPVRGDFNGSGDLTGLSEFQASDFIGISDGGTGATTASGVRSNLGLVIGTNVQAFDAQLTDVAGLAVTDGGFIVGDGSNFVLETGNTARASLGLGTSDSPTFNGLTLSGNLVINGTTTTINSTVVTVDDPIFTLGGDTAPASDDNKDRGIEFRYHTGSAAKVGFFGYDDSSGKFTFIPDATNTSEVFSGTAGTIVANLEGNVTGTVSSLSGLDTDNLSEGSSNLYFTNERVDDRVSSLLVDSASSGIDISYDDANNQLTISTDLGEITADLNERVDDRVDSLLTAGSNVSLTYDDAAGTLTIASTDTNTQLTTEQVQDIVGGMVDGGTETNVTVTYDDTNGRLNFVVDQLTAEQVQDIIGPMFASNTETFIDVSYDDSDGTLDLVVPVKDEDNMASDSASHLATQQSIKAYVDSQIQTEESIEDFVAGAITAGTNVSVTYDDAAGTITIASTDTNTQLTQEQVEDFVGGMVSSNTETLIGVTYDDTNGKINFVVDNDLANYDNSTSGFITATLTQEQVEDFVGGMLDGTETLITVSYDDTDGNIDFVVDNDLANYSNTNSAFITLASLSGGTGVTYNNGTGAISIGQAIGTTDNVTFNNLVLDGNLTVNGTTTAVESTTVTINDPMVRYADNNTGNSVDFGFYGKYVQSSTTKFGGLVWDASQTDKFRLFHGLQTEPTTTVDVSATGHTVGTLIANLEGNVTGNVTGNVSGSSGSTTGNAATATALASAQNFSLTGDVTASAVSFDGSGAVALSTTITDNSVQVGNIDFLVDEDNMASDSAVKVPTQQSVKAYVDSQVTAQDLDFQADSGGALAIDLDSETLSFTGGTGIDTSGSGNAVTIAIDSTVVTESSSDTLTNKTINLESNTVIVEYAVTVANVGGANKFLIDGESQATISFRPGVVHRFDLSDNSLSGHPFKLSTTDNGSHNSGSEYTTGKTTNGSQGNAGAYLEFTVNAATPDILYYYCSSHSGMGGTITVFGSAYGDADVQSYLSAGTGITLSGSGVIATTITQYADSDVQSYLSAGTGITLSGSGVIASSITQYADSDVQSYLSGGTGVTMSGSGEFSIGQAVATTSNVTFADVAATGNVVITGNLDVNGTTTTIDTTNTTVTDLLIELGNGTSGSPANDAGIVIERGSSDNAFIGWDESADKFIVGTGSFTGASTGNLTISTGTLVANLEGNASTATALATGRTVGMTGDVVWTSASFDGSGDVTGTATIQSGAVETAMLNANVITGQTAETSIADDDLILIYDNSASALRKMTKANFTAGLSGGGGTVTEAFRTIAVSGQTDIVADSATDSLTFAAGSNISLTTNASTDTVTIATDSTASPDFAGLTLTDTNANANSAPLLKLYRNSASPANGDDLGEIRFRGENSGGSETTYGFIQAEIDSAANSTGRLRFGAGDSGGVYKVDISNQGIELSAGSDIYFEGSSLDANQTKLTVTNPTADRIITLPNATGTVILSSSSIGDLSDVDITTSAPSNGQALVWNASNNEFEPGTVASSTNLFQTIAVSGQSNIVADSTADTLNFAAGANITLTTDASTDTVTIAATGGAANAFSTLAVSGQSNVVADAATDTLTLVAGTGMTIATDASADSITFTSSGSGGGGTMPFTDFDGTTDNIILSSAATGGALPVTLAGGSSDPINMTGTTQTLTSYADDDGDTKIEVERTTDNDTVHIKAGGTDVITATSSGVTVTNLTVTGTTTQANELKITDTLFELNADGGSLTTDAGMIVERGSTGDNAAFIWDESTDSWVAGTTATDGSAAANLTVTEGDLKAKTQNQSDNSTKVATTAYVDTALGSLSSNSITDADSDTKIQVEEGSDEDIIRADTGGQERLTIDNNVSMAARGGFFTHNLAMHASETFTIASTEGTVAAGPLDIQGTVDVQGSLVVL